MKELPRGTALIVIDVQRAIDHPSWGERNNPEAERRTAALLACWRDRGMPVYHVRHDSVEPQSTYRPGQPGHDFKPETAPVAGEPVIPKNTCCAFVGTDLERRLRDAGHSTLVFAGVITNNSVETTVRLAGCLGFACYLAADACFTFAKTDWAGRRRTADEVHAMSLANLDGEYCTVITAGDAIAMCSPTQPQPGGG